MWEKIKRAWSIKELRSSILFVLGLLVIFRLVAHIPVPGVNIESLRAFLASSEVLGLLNVFSGGTIGNFSLVLLGIAPYITASIIFQLLTMVIPRLEEISKEGEAGQQKINTYTRIATVPLALLQGYSFIKLLNQQQAGIFTTSLDLYQYVAIMLAVTAGTMFLMWIGELITEKKIGNGISLLIFAGIVSSLPTAIQTAIVNYSPTQLYTYIGFAAVVLITIVGVVMVSEGQRNIPVQYAKQMPGGRGMGQVQSHLPLRINMAGVIPIIFAISIVVFPSVIAQFFVNGTGRSAELARMVLALFQNQLFYGVFYFLLVVGFTYFYTSVIFQPQKIAENLQRQGGFIPGIRPGKQTEEYLGATMNRLVLTGALFLGIIAILPIIIQYITKSQSLVIGGTSLLIVVSVAIETTKQIEAQLTMHEYERV